MSTEKITFWILDVSYGVVGGIPEVRMWGIAEDGRRIVVLDRHFRPYFYVLPERNADIDSLIRSLKARLRGRHPILGIDIVERKYFGEPVKVLKITCSIPEDVKYYREIASEVPGVREVLEADIRFYMRYMIDNHVWPCAWHEVVAEKIRKPSQWRVDAVYLAHSSPKVLERNDTPNLRIMAFDIECYNPRGTPNPKRDPVIIISVATSDDEIKLFTAKDKDDRELLKEFIKFVNEYDPDIIVGYNNNRFDWPYLVERSKVLGIRLAVSRMSSEPSPSVYGHYSVVGRANVDLYDFAEEIPEVKVKTLENVADYLGVMPKDKRILIEGTEIYAYWDDPEKRKILLEYARQDAISTYGIADKILPFAMQLSRLVGLTLDQIGAASVGFRVEWYLMREAYDEKELIPNRVEKPYSTYKGAIVLRPKKGVHENIAVLDFSSMYPNIMIAYNISPDTYVPPDKVDDPSKYYIAPEVNHAFRKEPPGFYKKVLSRLLTFRKRLKEEMNKYPPNSIEYRILNERQKAVKVIANACYGYTGWLGARWYKREVAEATTAWGRRTIREAIKIAEDLGLEVIYGDTDSLFVRYDKGKVEEFIRTVKQKLGLEIKIDKIYVRVFFTEAKKRYCGLLPDGRIDVVGLEAVRGDWAEIAKEVQEKVIELVLKKGSAEDAVEYVKKVIRELKEGKVPMSKLILWKTVTKDFSEYAVEAAHVAAAKRLKEAGYSLEIGDKVGYVILKGGGKLAERAWPYQLVKDPKLIDYDYYIRKQIVPAALRILEYFGVTENLLLVGETKQTTLFDFMG
ncbi:MAG: DNA polymerase II [Thermoprotei archaeon]|nr:MAG: DNA polymerase II [Thermoprotei archaeon]RLF19879.1 MAG: DNA polymerase II [Thermoprotei archaeon]